MANLNAYLQTFAGGEFGDAMSARVAIDAYQASCELMENWFIKAQGPMVRRPSLEYIGSFSDSTLRGVLKRFEFDVGQNYLLLLTEDNIDFFLDDGQLTTDEITGAIGNGTFSNFSGWTDNSETGSSADASSGYLALNCNGPADAVARTTFTVIEGNARHVLAFDVENGPVNLRIGSSAGGTQYLNARELRRGHHRLEFTPTAAGTCHIQFWFTGAETIKLVDNVSLLGGPEFSMPAPWAEEDLRGVYTAQDGDRLWMFHRDYAPRVLERRDHHSWSLIYFEPNDGPFERGTPDLQLAPDGRIGQTSIISSGSVFTENDVRRLLRLTHPGQYKRKVANASGVFSDPIKVVGVGADRRFSANLSGTFTGTATLERSNGNTNDFSKVLTFTGTTSVVFNDSYKVADTGKGGTVDTLYNASNDTTDNPKGRLDNTTAYYRWAILADDWTSGTATMELSADSGSQTGLARITAYQSGTEVDVEVLSPFARAGATDVWDIGTWNVVDEYPNVVTFAHGRLWCFRRRQVWSSVSDDYFSFQDGVEADQSVQLTLRSKSAEGVRWARELDFLCVGTRNEEYIIRSTSLSEPIGPTAVEPSLQGEEGSAGIEAEIGGDSIIYIHRNRRRVMQFSHNPRALSEDSFVSVDLNRLNPDACEVGIINAVIQQEPDRRIYATLEDGTVKPALFRREEEIMGWATMTTQGIFEDALVLREDDEDVVYFIVRRLIGGSWVRMVERMRSEIQINPEDLVHLDSMLETSIDRPEFAVTPSALTGAVIVTSTDNAFDIGGNDIYTKVLLHFDDDDGSTSFIDDNEGGSTHSWTATGNTHIDTAQSKFGGSAALFDGTGDYITAPDHADFELGSSDFCIDAQFYVTVTGGSARAIIGKATDSFAAGWIIRREAATNVIAVYMRDSPAAATAFLTGTTQFTDVLNPGWHHVAVTRSGSTWQLFIDGVLEDSETASFTVADNAAVLSVGSWGTAGGQDAWQGWIDEVRISVGTARHTAAFTPPTEAYAGTSPIGRVMWIDGGRIAITARASAMEVSGTVVYPLLGKEDKRTGTRTVYRVPPGAWGLATPVSSITGLDHLEGETVQIWADMAYAGTAVVSGGAVSLPYTASRVFVGLPYASTWISLKLAYGAQKGTAINQNKGLHAMGFLLSDTADCLHFGDTPGNLTPLVALSQPAMLGASPRLFSGEAFRKFNGKTDRDPRIILTTVNPGPATVKALVPNIQVNE